MKANVHLMMLAAVVSSAVMADTFTWVGNGADNYWGTDANWSKSSGDSGRTKPDNADFAVFSQSEDLTVLLYQGANVQGVRLEQGAGSVTLTLDDGWYNGRQLLVRRTTASGTWTPGITNFVNLSSNPFTIKSGLNASLNILFSNAWGDFYMMPGVVFDCPVTSATDSRGWLLPQAALRTDNGEMNRTVFKRTATLYNTLHVGANHELWVSGAAATLVVGYGNGGNGVIEESVIDLNGLLVVDGATASVTCSNLNVAATGSIRGSGTIYGAVSATTGAKLLFDSTAPDNVLTFTAAADLRGFTVDATGLDPAQTYLVAKGTTSLPGVSAAQASLGWMTKAENGNVYLVSNLRTVDADVTLDADTDWSVSPVAVSDNVVIDLNGHDLSVGSIALGEGVTIVNSGANARLYVGLNSADKAWVTNMTLSSSIMPVFVGAAIDLPADYIPAGGIGFKDTSGQQQVYKESCAYGLAFLGGANLLEPWTNWNSDSGQTFAVTVERDNNVFTFNNGNGGTEPGAFSTTSFVGSGILTIVSSTGGAPVAPVVGFKGIVNNGFSGKLILKAAANYVKANGYGIRFEDDNNLAGCFTNGTVVLSWDGENAVNFSLRSGNYSTPPTYNIGNLETDGIHPENIVLSANLNGELSATVKVGWNNKDSVFAGTITNINEAATTKEHLINIEKRGTGTWTLTGTVANGGTFKVESGCVEFRNGLANVTGLTVTSGASALFAGDMGSNPISFAPGATLKLDASNEGDNVPVVNGNLDLTGVSVYVSQGMYAPDKHMPRELLRVTGTLTGFERNAVSTDIVADGWSFRLVKNADGTTSIFHQYRPGFVMVIR